jgi:O-antigen ligase
MAMMASLLVLISRQNILAALAFIPGLAGLLLSLTRAAWGGLVVGLIFIVFRVSGQLRSRLLMVIGVLAVLAIPLFSMNFIQEGVMPRVETLGSLEEEGSYRARTRFYENFGVEALTTPIGNGLGGTGKASILSGQRRVFDSGVMGVPFELGWPGAFLYVAGLLWIWVTLLRSERVRSDLFAIVSMGVASAIIAMLVFNNHLVGVKGMILWTFISLSLASIHYQDVVSETTPPAAPDPPQRSARNVQLANGQPAQLKR